MRKGVDVFYELAARVEQARPGQYRFVLKSHSRDFSGSDDNRCYGDAVLAIHGVFSFSDLCRLKSLADLYVSPHRSEGFGLNIVESILLGVPVLCSAYAGVTDLLADNEPALVPVVLREIGRAMGPYASEAIWCEPDLALMETCLLTFFEAGMDHNRFESVRQHLQAALSVEVVGAKLKSELERWCALGAEIAPDPFKGIWADRSRTSR